MKALKLKFMSVVTLAIIAVLALVGLTGCASDGGGADSSADVSEEYANLEPVTLILADSTGKGAAGNLWGEEIAKNASEITGGKLTVDYHPNGELGGDTDLLR